MKTHHGLSFEKFFLILILPVVLSGCAASYPVLMAAQYIPGALVAASYLPKGAEIELSEEDGGALDKAAMQKLSSAITDNAHVQEYFMGDGLFDTIKLTERDPPVGPNSASKIAQANNVDSYIMVDLIPGGVVQRVMLNSKILYGGATITIVQADGKVVYKQTAKLLQKVNSASNMSANEVTQILAKAITDDMKKSMVASIDAPKNQGLVVGDATPR